MKARLAEISRLYHAALQLYLAEGAAEGMEPARELGRQAMSLGLRTTDLASMHETALVLLLLPDTSSEARDALMGRAGQFLAKASTPMKETHRVAHEANLHLKEIVRQLSQRTMELAASVEELRLEISQRKAVEDSLRASAEASSKLLARSRQMEEELRLLSRQLLTAQEEERRKISRELHDVITQTLTGINVRLAALKAESNASTKELQRKITSTQRLVERSVDIVHRFARELRPTLLDDFGLIPALHSFMKSFTEDTGVRVTLTTFAEIELLDGEKRTMLYRVAQEALTNVARHAHASRAEMRIEKREAIIRMEITDDGRGFVVDGITSTKRHNRLGLLGMRERVEMTGGTFCVESSPGKHTTLRVEIPVI